MSINYFPERRKVSPVPPHQELLWPAVLAMRDPGDSGSIDEFNDRVLEVVRGTRLVVQSLCDLGLVGRGPP